MYTVVFRDIFDGPSKGAITYTLFKSKEEFDKWYDDKMRTWYEVVEEGVTQERAQKLCSSPQAQLAVVVSSLREITNFLDDAGVLNYSPPNDDIPK